MGRVTVTVITPVGPGHEALVARSEKSVAEANSRTGIQVNHSIVKDYPTPKGRSAVRNCAADEAGSDWLFFLDADDVMHPWCFRCFEECLSQYPERDAYFGTITTSCSDEGIWVLRKDQPLIIKTYEEFIHTSPFTAVQIGHFVRRDIFLNLRFKENLDCGEDYDYYLRLWRYHNPIKLPFVFFINYRDRHSTGPRSASGKEWVRTVGSMRGRAVNEEIGVTVI